MTEKDRSDIEQALPRTQPRHTRPATEFWQEFRARADAMPQDEPAERAPAVRLFPRWVAAAAALLLVCGGVWLAMLTTGPRELVPPPGNGTVLARAPTGNEIKAVEVFVPTDGYIVMNDEPETGTILWISSSNLE